MQRDAEEQIVRQPKFHLTHKAISQLIEIVGADPEELAAQVLSDLNKVGDNPFLGFELDREEAERVHGEPLSQVELDRVATSRLYCGNICSVYWCIETLENSHRYAAIWAIELHEGNEEDPIAIVDKIPEWIDETYKRVQEKPPE